MKVYIHVYENNEDDERLESMGIAKKQKTKFAPLYFRDSELTCFWVTDGINERGVNEITFYIGNNLFVCDYDKEIFQKFSHILMPL